MKLENIKKIESLKVFDDKFKIVKRDAKKIFDVYGMSEEEFDKIVDEVIDIINDCEISGKDLAKLDKVPKALIVAVVISSSTPARVLTEDVISIIEEIDDFKYIADLIEVIDNVKQPYQAAYLSLLQGADKIADVISANKMLKALFT